MGLHNSERRFGTAAMTLHWLIAVCVIGLLAVGKIMTGESLDLATKFQLYQLHKSFGVLVFMLMVLRLCWRWTQTIPAYPATMQPWEKAGAHVSHWGFYLLLIVMPLTGWALVSAATFKVPTLLFGTIPLPHLPFLENAGGSQGGGRLDEMAARDTWLGDHRSASRPCRRGAETPLHQPG